MTFEHCSRLLRYEESSGLLFWKENRGRLARAGAQAGHVRATGYVQVIVDGKAHSGHRVAWLLSFGKWPDGEIDHIDGNRSNNRLKNLRVVDRTTNTENRRVSAKTSVSGLLGASPRRNGKWLAQIQVLGAKRHLGLFDTPEAAHAAYVKAKRELHAGNTL